MTRIEKDKWYICHTQFGLVDVGFKVKYTDYINRNGLRFVGEDGMYYSIKFEEIEKYFKPIEVKEKTLTLEEEIKGLALESPEKIYVPTAGNEIHYHMTCPYNEFQESIEYTRTDVFIEKAGEWLEEHTLSELNLDFGHSLQIKEFIDIFKDYMKGQ